MRHCLVLAGGSGTRLGPLSTASAPKQLVPLLRGRSLLELAVERARAVVPAGNVWLGAGPALAHAVPSLTGLRPDRLVVEPAPRDTLPAVALGCAAIEAADPGATVVVLTADHVIEPVDAVAAAVEQAAALTDAADDVLATFGVLPDAPATGFGWLELGEPLGGGARVRRFREKPDLATAQRLLAEGALWNSGMFVWRAATLLRAVRAFSPDTAAAVDGVLAGDPRAWQAAPRLSVDVGVMEPASTSAELTVAAVPLAARWLDVGSWPAYGQALGRDADGNAVDGRAVLHDSSGCVVASAEPGHLVALVGCEGLVVAHTATATLVVPVEQAQRVKELHARVVDAAPELS